MNNLELILNENLALFANENRRNRHSQLIIHFSQIKLNKKDPLLLTVLKLHSDKSCAIDFKQLTL
mgnify:CR=1 FL=1